MKMEEKTIRIATDVRNVARGKAGNEADQKPDYLAGCKCEEHHRNSAETHLVSIQMPQFDAMLIC